jgi:hypothetical protein
MIAKTTCQHCDQHIEFEVEHAGSFISCPNCGKQTRLIMPGKKLFEKKAEPQKVDFKQQACPACAAIISSKARFCVHCGEPFPDKLAGGIIGFFAVIMFIVGAALFVDGFAGHSENIMQQSYLQARECFGLILMTLAVLTAGIVRIIRK